MIWELTGSTEAIGERITNCCSHLFWFITEQENGKMKSIFFRIDRQTKQNFDLFQFKHF